ncbi:MAG: hypothetical protein E6974_08810 [Veillonella sp.]|nr:hypothetical protein [Veillonella sp.]
MELLRVSPEQCQVALDLRIIVDVPLGGDERTEPDIGILPAVAE